MTSLVGGMGEVHLLDLLVTFDTNDHDIFLDQLRGLGMCDTVPGSFNASR